MTDASVELWGKQIGAVSWLADRGVGVFQYTPEFAQSGIQVAPLTMPLRTAPYEFPELSYESFKGLPGMLSDSLPDKFGNALINMWLAQQGRDAKSFNPVERLCYIGTRGIGALEFKPVVSDSPSSSRKVKIERLVELSNRVLDERLDLHGSLHGTDDVKAIEDILRVGTSAGGARAKAVLAWNETTGEFRSGQVEVDDESGEGFSYWLMKFDGVEKNSDKELADPLGYGRIEYAYYLMAKDAGITMADCRLHQEGQRAHFMTRRFDRTRKGNKLHYQSLGAIKHFDFEMAGAYSYEQAIIAIKQLDLHIEDVEQQVRRAFFNIIARNQDDHVKNIGFLMNQEGEWRLSPAFDVAYSYNPQGAWTSQHQMSLNGKRDNFSQDDLITFAKMAGIKKYRAKQFIEQILEVVSRWGDYAREAGVFEEHVGKVQKALRLELFKLIK